MKKIIFCLVCVSLCASFGFAQEFEIKKYDLNARVVPEQLKVDVQAKLRLVNLSGSDLTEKILLSTGDRPRLLFFLNPKAQVETMKVNGAPAQFKTAEDARNNLIRVYTDITSGMAALREFDVDFAYSIPSADRSTALHVSSEESYLL
ncbi:MAG: siderophore-interacting protein, partial [Acidobacteria bacterium]|nr:siderophore-interacting protein [Acidobacteriota bacterium]